MATCYETLSLDDCHELLSLCKGLRISGVWRSIDPCVFLEIGRLSRTALTPVHVRLKATPRQQGQVTFMIESDWRIEKPRSIQVGSGFRTGRIDKGLASLVGVSIVGAELAGAVPELTLLLDDRRRFRTFTNWTHQPRWSFGFNDASLFPLRPEWKGVDVIPWVHVQAGRIEIEYCYDHRTAQARKAIKKMGFK